MDISDSKFHIRKIRSTDNERVKDIILSVMTSYGCIGDGYSSSDPEIQYMFEAYDDDRSVFYVIEDERGDLYGCGGIGPLVGEAETVCELKKMYFLPKLRNKGFGQSIIDICLNSAIEYGYKICYLETLEAMKAANHLYQKNGFVKLKDQMGNTGHSGCDTFYSKQLT